MTVPIKIELNNGKTITHKLKFINSFRFMASKLSDLVDNLSGIYIKEKEKKSNQNVILSGLKTIN